MSYTKHQCVLAAILKGANSVMHVPTLANPFRSILIHPLLFHPSLLQEFSYLLTRSQGESGAQWQQAGRSRKCGSKIDAIHTIGYYARDPVQ